MMDLAGTIGIEALEDTTVFLQDSIDPIDEFVGISIQLIIVGRSAIISTKLLITTPHQFSSTT